ncbi:hypothetical protein CCR75_008876 [Bremia lactucae]|uniref:RING-type E3 ubiquitin transferase (cysteine targeting) n=1 Tax=Bremia lactucae TaxID=4779 RepID=A0A976FPS8_BRELC|nr:hypothetical protein CCR75_008876 [Bremia lactucae]
MQHVQAAAAAQLESQLSIKKEKSSKLRVPYKVFWSPSSLLRVNKWDALILDSEILSLLKSPMKGMFDMFEPGVVVRFQMEIDALLKFMLFLLSIGLGRPTPGMKLENIHYSPHLLSRSRVGAFLFLSVGLPYVWKRLLQSLSSARWTLRRHVSANDAPEGNNSFPERLVNVMKKFELLALTCQLANLLIFVRYGIFRSLPERLLGLKLESIMPSITPRAINFEYMTRQFIWTGLMPNSTYCASPFAILQEFGSFILPVLAYGSCRLIAASQKTPFVAHLSQCCLCGMSPPQTPYVTSCKHVYCYYCLQAAVALDEKYECVACGLRFDSSQRLATKISQNFR